MRQGSLFGTDLRSFQRPGAHHNRIGVVDVGSNSVRMVVFEGARRCPALVFNEKVLCGLGADLKSTGRLSPEGKDRAIRALKRFVGLAETLKIGALAGVATAAVRDAKDGPAFRDQIEKTTNIRLDIASGEDEARLAAQGVLFGDPQARGLVMDLGGASLELCPVRQGKPGQGVTTPLGPQRMPDPTDREAVLERVRKTLTPYRKRYAKAGQRLYLVGGAWRALGRVQINWSDHPLPVLHEYCFTAQDALNTLNRIRASDRDTIGAVQGMPSGRVSSVAYAATLLEGLIETFSPSDISISGFGLREGVCYGYLPDRLRAQDPLLSTCEGQEYTRARGPGFGRELARWLLMAVEPLDAREKRLIRAAAHLVDVSWRAHPDYRPRACMEVVTRVNVSGVGHHGRAFIAAILLNRYKGARKAIAEEPAMALLSDAEKDRAAALGLLMRLACTIAGTTPGHLTHCPLSLSEGVLRLSPWPKTREIMGEEVEKRLAQAARALGAAHEIV